jgi:formiminoglutamase
MPRLQLFKEDTLISLIAAREGETKLGSCIHIPSGADRQHDPGFLQARFVVLGLPEDIGVRGNGGIGGAHTAWPAFLKSFLNIQETEVLSGQDFFLLGHIDFSDWLEECSAAGTETLRLYTAQIDELVYPLIQEIVSAGKIPLVIGGGHNNAYPLLKGLSLAHKQAVNALNLDAHSDFRMQEGRHSGNGFRYAYAEAFLKQYAMLGLHEGYNSKNIVTELKENPDLLPLFWEDIFLRRKESWEAALQRGLAHVSNAPFGVELDVDAIERVLSSAATPVGIGTAYALDYLYQCGLSAGASYLHLPEGVSNRTDGLADPFTGKLLSYLVQAFAKGVLERG